MSDWPPDHLTDASDPNSLLSRWNSALDSAQNEWIRRYGSEEEHQLFRDITEAFRPSIRSLEIGASLIDTIRRLSDEVGAFDNGCGFRKFWPPLFRKFWPPRAN
jgi:hypothetical protein